MAFPRSQRFVEKGTCAPPPTAYYLPSVFDENTCSTWVKPCTHDHLWDQCRAYRKSHDQSAQNSKSSEATLAPLCTKQSAHASPCDNHEICSFQKKDLSNIPRFKRNVNQKLTEPKAPSFMTRPRHSIHNCFATNADEPETSFVTSNFHRHSLKRKSLKLVRENIEKTPENLSPFKVLINPSLQDNTQLNVSYVIRNENSDKVKDASDVGDISKTFTTGSIPRSPSNITDDMKESKSLQNLYASSTEDNTDAKNEPNLNLEISGSTDKEISEKNDSLHTEFLNSLDDTKLSNTDANNIEENALINKAVSSEKLVEEAAKQVKIEIENAIRIKRDTEKKSESLKSYYLSSDIESHVVFLISEEFIDDDYDSYVKDITLEKLHGLEDVDLFSICKALIRMYMEKTPPKRKGVHKVKKGGMRKVKKNIKIDIKKLTKIGRNKSKDIWSEVEKIVRAAITDLKGEFKNEIYKKTEEKVDTLMSKLAKILLKAEDNIDISCERTTTDLINKLEKIVN